MSRVSTVSIHDNLAAGKTGVTVRSADNEAARRVDIENRLVVHHLCRKHRVKDVLANVLVKLLLRHIRVVLRREHYRMQMHGLAVLIVLHRNLGFAVRTKIRECSVLANLGKLLRKLVGKADGIRHQLRGLIGGIAEHHALIAGTDVELVRNAASFSAHSALVAVLAIQGLVNAHGDVCRLLIKGNNDAAGIGVKAVFGAGITDFSDGVTHRLLNIHVTVGGNLAHHKHKARRNRRLTGDAAHRILCDQCIQHRVRNLVADFIGMPLGHRLRSKQPLFQINHLLRSSSLRENPYRQSDTFWMSAPSARSLPSKFS